jgi:hypothetical protein
MTLKKTRHLTMCQHIVNFWSQTVVSHCHMLSAAQLLGQGCWLQQLLAAELQPSGSESSSLAVQCALWWNSRPELCFAAKLHSLCAACHAKCWAPWPLTVHMIIQVQVLRELLLWRYNAGSIAASGWDPASPAPHRLATWSWILVSQTVVLLI